MRNLFAMMAVGFLLLSCDKKNTLSNRQRLTRVLELNSGGSFPTDLSYDAQGRLVQINGRNGAIIKYSGNTITLENNSNSPADSVERSFTLDANRRPLSQTYSQRLHFYQGSPEPEYHFITAQSQYQFGATGTISQITGQSYDSLNNYTSPGVHFVQTIRTTSNTIFTVDANTIKSVVKTQQVHQRYNENGIVRETDYQISETTEFSYTLRYPNQFDFANTLLLSTQQFLPYPAFYYDARWTYIPDKAVTTRVTRDKNGAVLDTQTFTEAPVMQFNKPGFVVEKKDTAEVNQYYYSGY